MPARVNITTPGEFIRQHLVQAGGMDYVQSIYTDYKEYLLGVPVKRVCTRATMSYYIWLCNQLGLIQFDHAEAVNYWDGMANALTPPANYVRESRPQAPSPRHYYRIVDEDDPRWASLQKAYRSERGFQAPKHVKRLYPEKQTTAMAPSELEALRWALSNASLSGLWQTEGFKKGREGEQPYLSGRVLIIPGGSLTRDYIDDLIGRLKKYQELRQAAIPKPPGREGARILNQIRYTQRLIDQLQAILKQLRAPVKRPKPVAVEEAIEPEAVEAGVAGKEQPAKRGRPRIHQKRVKREPPVTEKTYIDTLMAEFDKSIADIMAKVGRLATSPAAALEEEVEADLMALSGPLTQAMPNIPIKDVAARERLQEVSRRLSATFESLPLLKSSLVRVLTDRPGMRADADRRAYQNAVKIFGQTLSGT